MQSWSQVLHGWRGRIPRVVWAGLPVSLGFYFGLEEFGRGVGRGLESSNMHTRLSDECLRLRNLNTRVMNVLLCKIEQNDHRSSLQCTSNMSPVFADDSEINRLSVVPEMKCIFYYSKAS